MRNIVRFIIATIALILIVFLGFKLFYNWELIKIKSDLNSIPNAQVKNIWGHEDFTLEEIAARIYINNKGEIVLCNLSGDAFDYPEHVYLQEINGLSFNSFECDGNISISHNLDIGKNTPLGKLIGIQFRTSEDVIKNYDKILEIISNLKKSPEINYFENNGKETYLLIRNLKSNDLDAIYALFGVENEFDFAKKLNWKKASCK